MKTALPLLAIIFVAFAISAVTPTSDGTSQTSSSGTTNTNQSAFSGVTITNNSGEALSSDEIQSQLAELRRVIEETTPMLGAVTQSYSNSPAGGKPSVAGGIAGVLGGILVRTNNASGESSTKSTNTLGRILQGVLSATSTNASPMRDTEFQDLLSLQQHLQAMGPILQRLGVSTHSSAPSAVGGTKEDTKIEKGQREY